MSKLAVTIGSCFVCLLVSLAPASRVRAADVSVRLDAGSGFAVRDSTGFVQRLRVDEATGNVSRNGALFVHTTGFGGSNLFVGGFAGNLSSFTYNNTGMGYGTLFYVTSGSANTAVGSLALLRTTTGFFNTAMGYRALLANTSGYWNTAVGGSALASNTTAPQNSAFGTSALAYNTTGSSNSAFGSYALRGNTTGGENSAFGQTALRFNTTGTRNAAFGRAALYQNVAGNNNAAFGHSALQGNTDGVENSALGSGALRSNTTGLQNTALGSSALAANTGGSFNAAVGRRAMYNNTTGNSNSAFGHEALRSNTNGILNVAIGSNALRDLNSGSRNVALGEAAGFSLTTGDNNIYIANAGLPSESGQIKIGRSPVHTQVTLAGVWNATSAGGVGVLVNSSGQLGTTTSSARFKQNVRDMDHASDVLMKLRPVAFNYREDVVGAEDAKTTQYGLIAEEVAQVAPELVAPDLDGKPYSVKYHELPALLLAQNQQLQRTVDAQRELIEVLAARVERLEAR